MARTRGQPDNNLNQDTEVDDKEGVSRILLEELVEKIIAKMPFPSVLKAGVLSKSWEARLSPVSSLNDEESKRLATGFQKQLLAAEWSSDLGTFYPVCTTEKDLIGYDQASRKWRTLPPLSFSFSVDNSRVHFLGTLLYEMGGTCRCAEEQQLSVENMFIPEGKELLVLPDDVDSYVTYVKLLSDTISGTYKLIIFCRNDNDDTDLYPDNCMYICHSKQETGSSILQWDSYTCHGDQVGHENPLNYNSIAFLDGALYMLKDVDRQFWEYLWCFDVDSEESEELTLSCHNEIDTDLFAVEEVRLAARNGSLMMVLMESSSSSTIHVFQIDVQSRRSWEVAQCAFAAFRLDTSSVPISEVTCIFHEMGDREDSKGLMLVYDQRKDEWSFFSFPRTPYRWSAISLPPRPSLHHCDQSALPFESRIPA